MTLNKSSLLYTIPQRHGSCPEKNFKKVKILNMFGKINALIGEIRVVVRDVPTAFSV
jgi:hypothetical protein